MWFNNLKIYNYSIESEDDINEFFEENRLKSCPPHARFIFGWSPVQGEQLIHEVAGCSLICMGKEERLLPRGVINKILAEKVQLIETQHGRSIKRAEKAQMAEDIEFELLPKSFCVQKRLFAIMDKTSHRLIINSSSDNQAMQLTGLLRKTIPGISIEPLAQAENLAIRFAKWIQSPSSLPENLTLASDCVLFSPDNEKKRIHCKGYELPADEVLSLLSQGMITAEISLIWKARIQFTLTQDFTFKKLKSLDYLVDDFAEIKNLETDAEQLDAELVLLAGELSALSTDLNDILQLKTPELESAI